MNAEIIAVGSELLTPARVDTNSLFLTAQLNELGIEVTLKTIVGDDRERLTTVVRAAIERSDLVLITGGLGPTEDDVTRDAVAAALGRSQTLSQQACDEIQARFARLNRPMADINRRQAMMIEGAEILSNPNGTAPGQWLLEGRASIALLPGPPREMEPMYVNHCRARVLSMVPPLAIAMRIYRIAMMGESDVDQLIAPVYTKYTNPATTMLAGIGDVQVHLRSRCPSMAEAEARVDELGAQIEALLGDRIYSNDGSPLEERVGVLLQRRAATLAVAESCTGGLVAERLTSVPGSSGYFAGGFITYTEEMKIALLGVYAETLKLQGAVSAEAAEAMAIGCRERTGADYAVSVTGVAGPEGGTEAAPVGTVFIGLASESGCTSKRFQWGGERIRVRGLASQAALEMLRRKLLV
jgi:nicotinamide-nucleotide amidase